MPPATDTTPIRDPRNAVGLLTDVLELALTGPRWPTLPTAVRESMLACVALGRESSKMPRNFANGYKRRGGSSELYQRVKLAREKLPGLNDLWNVPTGSREPLDVAARLAERVFKVVVDVLEDVKRWERFTNETREPANTWMRTPALIHPPEWIKAWHDHVSEALRIGADGNAIMVAECNWRFRDLTDRSHRGRNVRAAWEAAWLSGNYKFATQLIESIL